MTGSGEQAASFHELLNLVRDAVGTLVEGDQEEWTTKWRGQGLSICVTGTLHAAAEIYSDRTPAIKHSWIEGRPETFK